MTVVVVLLGKGLLIVQAAEKEALKKEENRKTQPLNQDQGGAKGRRGHARGRLCTLSSKIVMRRQRWFKEGRNREVSC